jgi:microcystin-dependent protein
VHRDGGHLPDTQLTAAARTSDPGDFQMSEPYLSQITMFGGNFAPKRYAFCNGQTLSIQQNTALFSLIGTTYGGNGVTTFQLPNLQSALPISFGQAPGLQNYNLGEIGGTPSVTLNQNNVPPHIHFLMASTSASATTSPMIQNNLVPGTASATNADLYTNPGGSPPLIPHKMTANAVGPSGNNQPHPNLMPSLCITFVIALQGVFPTRN